MTEQPRHPPGTTEREAMGERARAVDRDAFLPVKIGLSRIEAAAFIGVGEMTFDYLVFAGDMPQARRFGDVDRWLRPEIERFLMFIGYKLDQQGTLRGPHPGLIYVVGYGDFIKIGFTTNLDGRLRSLQTCAPVKLTLYRYMFGTTCDERRLHERFAALRLEGEWFRCDGDIKGWLSGEVCDD